MNNLAVLLLDDDPAVALAWYKESAAQGYARAYYNLGILYLAGGVSEMEEDLPPDPQKALQFFQAVAEWTEGDTRRAQQSLRSKAYYNLGVMHTLGLGMGGSDLGAARDLFVTAAQAGSVAAIQSLEYLEETKNDVALQSTSSGGPAVRDAKENTARWRRLLEKERTEGSADTGPGPTTEFEVMDDRKPVVARLQSLEAQLMRDTEDLRRVRQRGNKQAISALEKQAKDTQRKMEQLQVCVSHTFIPSNPCLP